MRRKNSTNRTVLLIAFIMAILLQIPVLELLHRQTLSDGDVGPVQKHRTLNTRLSPLKRKAPPEKKKAEMPDATIVELPPPEEDVTPKKDAKFLSEHNTRTEKETKAKRRSRSRSKRNGKVRVKKRSQLQSDTSASRAETKLASPTKETVPPQPNEKIPQTTQGELPKVNPLQHAKKHKLFLPVTNEESASSNIQATSGLFTSNDALLDIQVEDDETSLNSKRFRFAYYFNRIKERVSNHWDPAQVYRQRDPSGRVLGVKDRLTVLRITLNDKGHIKRVETAKNSGAGFLDKEAERAFAMAGPFLNPPDGLVDDKGEIVFRFGFLFEISNKPSFFWKR
jgi:hypothetical protein